MDGQPPTKSLEMGGTGAQMLDSILGNKLPLTSSRTDTDNFPYTSGQIQVIEKRLQE